MKKKFLVVMLSLIAALCAGVALAGCDLLSNFNGNHTHVPSSKWEADSTYHWHDCTVIGCSEQVDKAEHTLTHIQANEATCVSSGNIEYWHCSECDKKYADANATQEISAVSIGAQAHSPIAKHDNANHWQECQNCHTITVAKKAHTASSFVTTVSGHYKVCLECGEQFAVGAHTANGYIKNKKGHYKVCLECGEQFDIGAHTEGEDCSICGYSVNYADKCSSDYGYNYLGLLTDGAKYQSFYEKIDELALAFHDDQTKTASSVTVTGGDSYFVAGEVNYASLGLSLNQAGSVWATYRNDHPLYYWLTGQIVHNSQTLSLCVDEGYKSGSERKAQNELLYNEIDEYLNAVSGETDAYQIALAFHDIIIDNISYARDENGYPQSERWAHSVLGTFTMGKAVCEGYAKAFSLLLNACGVDNVYVTGESRNEGHAWNIVKIGDGWYWYDLTWDDQPHIGGGIIYNYLCKEGAVFTDHTVGEVGNMGDPMNFLYAIPSAATTAYNSSALELGEQFTLDNFTYEVCGYNKVSLQSAGAASGEVVLTDYAAYGTRNYSLTEIGKDAFVNCNNMTALTIPKSVKVVRNYSLVNRTKLSEVTFTDKDGWLRSSNDGNGAVSFEVPYASLENPASAAALLKQTYNMYTYTWVKSASAS